MLLPSEMVDSQKRINRASTRDPDREGLAPIGNRLLAEYAELRAENERLRDENRLLRARIEAWRMS